MGGIAIAASVLAACVPGEEDDDDEEQDDQAGGLRGPYDPCGTTLGAFVAGNRCGLVRLATDGLPENNPVLLALGRTRG
jgi:hypothetical protein